MDHAQRKDCAGGSKLKSRAGLRVADRVGEMGTRMIDLQNKNEYWMVGE